jgi:predicted amidohydrolase YtcJ
MIAAVDNAIAMIGPGDHRPVMSYAHTVREDQLDRMAALGIVPSFFTGQLYFRGDLYLESVLGKERSDRLSPCRSALRRGMYFSIHNDEPDVPPNVLFLIGNAVNRVSRNGRLIGPDQRIEAVDALKAVTIWAARQIFEEDSKGSLEVGKLADLVILSDNPLEVAPEEIEDVEVVATFKEGSMVYCAP